MCGAFRVEPERILIKKRNGLLHGNGCQHRDKTNGQHRPSAPDIPSTMRRFFDYSASMTGSDVAMNRPLSKATPIENQIGVSRLKRDKMAPITGPKIKPNPNAAPTTYHSRGSLMALRDICNVGLCRGQRCGSEQTSIIRAPISRAKRTVCGSPPFWPICATVPKLPKLRAKPKTPIRSTGFRPMRSLSFPKYGLPMNCISE